MLAMLVLKLTKRDPECSFVNAAFREDVRVNFIVVSG